MELFIDRQAGRIALSEVEQTFANYASAIERILGAPAGSVNLLDHSLMQAWYG